jgi:hypothetical protein
MAILASAEQGSGGSGTAKGGVHEGKESGTQERQQPDTPPQAGSQGQQGMKGPGSPMEKDKGGDKMIDDKAKAKEKKK